MTEFLDRLNRALGLLEVAEDQIIEARTELLLCDCYDEAVEVKVIRESLKRILPKLRDKVRENISVEDL